MKEYNSKWTGSEVDTAVQDVKLKISRSEKAWRMVLLLWTLLEKFPPLKYLKE